MTRVWFVFKIFEAILGLSCLGYHTRGFLNVGYVQSHYSYCAIFGAFTLMPMFGCISACMHQSLHPLFEGLANLLGAISMIGVSLDSMFHAEKDFYLTYLAADEKDNDEDINEPHPFFKYSKAQSVAALCCGCLFMLHTVFVIVVALADEKNADASIDSDETDEDDDESSKPRGIHLYVCGNLHKWLDKYEWFKRMSNSHMQMISEGNERRQTV